MPPSAFLLYSLVGTQAATALLLACSLLVLCRFYPRHYLRVWAASWFAACCQFTFGAVAVAARSGGFGPIGVISTIATWLSQWGGYVHAVLLMLGAWALAKRKTETRAIWLPAVAAMAVLALLPTLAVPLDASRSSAVIRVSIRVGLLAAVTATAAFVSAALISRATGRVKGLGTRWMIVILCAIGVTHATLAMGTALSTALRGDLAARLVQLLPLVGALFVSALGIGTAIAMVEDEQHAVRIASERQLIAERVARASGAKLVSALAAVSDLVTVLGPDGRLVAWNPAFESFLGLHDKSTPVAGVFMLDTMPGAELSMWSARIAELLQGHDQAFEAVFEHPSAPAEYFDVSARPIRDNAEVVGGVIVARAVTERRKLEQQLQQAQRLDTVGRLAGGIAHDFNNLLTAILSSASVAREILPDDHEVQADLADVQLAGERATQLTKQLLAFARRQPVSQQPMELNERVAAMERMLTRLVGPDVALRVTLDDGLWPVRADGPQLEQVLVNVVVNARDAMPTGGRLTIRTANRTLGEGAIVLPRPMPAGDYVEIVVVDNGTGMDEETLAHVFEPFYTTKPVGQGTGLGLAMCYGIVRQHHGVIWIESGVGRGTTVYILLPRYDGPLPARSDASLTKVPTPVNTGTETILLVEDEPQVRAVAARALRSAGYLVLEATNGRDGVQVARRERDAINLILTDVVMPEMGGKEMVELARQFVPSAAVLYVSGFTAGSFPLVSDDPAANNFLQKPFTPPELLAMVRQVLDRHAAPRPVEGAV
jgi:two-component system, cell cycle sensor histidine kinase and response regulator CckA